MKFNEKIKKLGILAAFDDLFGNIFSHLHYLWCRITKKVYFGSYLAAKQGQAIRHFYMQKLVEQYCKEKNEKIMILEVGSWAGGSAITWANAIEKYGKNGGVVLCVDQWRDYIQNEGNLWTLVTMKKALKSNKIYDLFLHNIKSSKYNDIIFTFNGSSSQNLQMLKNNQFDIIFIDGDHSYTGVISDINNSAPLLKQRGIICGDDLEVQFSKENQFNIEKNKNADVTIDEFTGKRYHPGVTLAVWNYFKREVSCWEGFWAMEKDGDTFNKLALDYKNDEIEIPEHLQWGRKKQQ